MLTLLLLRIADCCPSRFQALVIVTGEQRSELRFQHRLQVPTDPLLRLILEHVAVTSIDAGEPLEQDKRFIRRHV